MKLEFRDDLIFTSIHIAYRGVVKEINGRLECKTLQEMMISGLFAWALFDKKSFIQRNYNFSRREEIR